VRSFCSADDATVPPFLLRGVECPVRDLDQLDRGASVLGIARCTDGHGDRDVGIGDRAFGHLSAEPVGDRTRAQAKSR
jgi:hypothetical protein